MKGVSPLIAVILLIAFTVAVGGLISLFLTGFTKTQAGEVETIAKNQTKCAGVYISIDSVTSNLIKYSNPSTQTITDINISTEDGTYVNMAGASTTLSRGQSGLVNFTRGTNSSVDAIGLCLASIVVNGKCEIGQYCWK